VNPIDVTDVSVHTYTTPGVYPVVVTVMDDDGGVNQAIYQYVVVYDPNDGFVTGGGWIYSDAGAYLPDPTLEGRASFGFVSKYTKKDTSPIGQTAFHLNVADLNFHSDTYQWLVIAGNNAKFKGDGTINGKGHYGFMITATDGQYKDPNLSDAFRIKIWDKNDNDLVVYDNKSGLPDDDPAGTELGGGNVVIHDGGDKLVADSLISQQVIGNPLLQDVLDEHVEAAIRYWADRNVPAQNLQALRQVDVYVAELNGPQLGLASSSNVVWIDRDAAGFGWDLDSHTSGGMDLLHVIRHELGYEHTSQPFDVMAATLYPRVEWGHGEYVNLLVDTGEWQLGLAPLPVSVDEPLNHKTADDAANNVGLWVGWKIDSMLLPTPKPIDSSMVSFTESSGNDASVLADYLDEETELIEEELLNLLVKSRD
jgi:PKD repeat protein